MTETEMRLAAVRAEREALRIQLEQERERSRGFEQQVHDLLDDMEPLAAERDALKTQLAALVAEHKEAAKVAALHFERIAAFAADIADFSSEGVGGPLLQIEGMARAALVQVQP